MEKMNGYHRGTILVEDPRSSAPTQTAKYWRPQWSVSIKSQAWFFELIDWCHGNAAECWDITKEWDFRRHITGVRFIKPPITTTSPSFARMTESDSRIELLAKGSCTKPVVEPRLSSFTSSSTSITAGWTCKNTPFYFIYLRSHIQRDTRWEERS